MMRKPLAVAIVLLLAGFAPAVAIVGFCQTMPCCHQSADAAVDAATPQDCCPTITCDETPSANVPAPPTAVASLVIAPATTIVLRSTPRSVETSPPPPAATRSRLAILSTLLI